MKAVIRAFPIAVLRPVAGVMEGVSYTMLGLRNDLDPASRIDEEDRWNVDIGAFPASPVYNGGNSVYGGRSSGGNSSGGSSGGHVTSSTTRPAHNNTRSNR